MLAFYPSTVSVNSRTALIGFAQAMKAFTSVFDQVIRACLSSGLLSHSQSREVQNLNRGTTVQPASQTRGTASRGCIFWAEQFGQGVKLLSGAAAAAQNEAVCRKQLPCPCHCKATLMSLCCRHHVTTSWQRSTHGLCIPVSLILSCCWCETLQCPHPLAFPDQVSVICCSHQHGCVVPVLQACMVSSCMC